MDVIPLSSHFDALYSQVMKMNMPIASFWSWRKLDWCIRVQGPLTELQANQLPSLPVSLAPLRPSHIADVPVWKLTQNELFSIGFFYKFFNCGGLNCPFAKVLWRICAPEKVEIFLWLATRNKLHTCEVLTKKGWNVSNGCALYGSNMKKSFIFSLDAHSLRIYGLLLSCI